MQAGENSEFVLADVPDEALSALLSAQARQLASQQARVWATMAEIARRDPMPNAVPRWTPEQIFDSAVDEIRAELLLTRRSARRELERADTVVGQRRVFEALQRGELDRTRAIVLADGCCDLTAEQTGKLLDRLLPEAGTRTASSLAERVRKIAIALDPRWAERRYKAAVRERRVIGYLNSDGSATVSGQYLPAEQAATACDRVDALADAAKRAGAKASIDHLRAELFLALLDGRFQQLNSAEIVAALCAQFPADDNPAEAGPELGPVRGVELKVGIGTLLGLDEQPGEIAGWGPVTAAVARNVAAHQHGGQWRFAIVDAAGRLLTDGTTRHRPHGLSDAVQSEGGIVELHVPAALLEQTELAVQHPAWATVLADLATQHGQQRPSTQDPAARFPGKPLRRRTQLRFQRCVFPGCRRPASDCDLDHRRDYARHGRTDEPNLAPACRHDHMNKTRGGWRLVQIDEHTYRWISPLGRKHTVCVEPVAPALPAPIVRELPAEIEPREYDDPSPSFRALTLRGRPLAAAKPTAGESDPDPPPF